MSKLKAMLIAPMLLAAGAVRSASPPDPPAAIAHVARAEALAGAQFARSLFLCDPQGNQHVAAIMVTGARNWLPPTQAFDNLYFIGNDFVGVWILRTSQGLILFDSSQSAAEARDHLVPGLKALHLDPASIRYVIVTHAHWDHYGGAKYLQETYGASVALSGPDWTLLEQAPVGGMERAPLAGDDRSDRPIPRHDLVIADGQKLTLGDTTVTLYVSPGHTPGTLSAIIPAREHGRTYPLSLLGGTAFPPTLEPTDRAGGLRAFSASVERLSKLSEAARAVGVINTHIFVDGSTERLSAARTRRPGQSNPFLIGTDAVLRYYGMFDECLRAAAERPIAASDWSRPLPLRGE